MQGELDPVVRARKEIAALGASYCTLGHFVLQMVDGRDDVLGSACYQQIRRAHG